MRKKRIYNGMSIVTDCIKNTNMTNSRENNRNKRNERNSRKESNKKNKEGTGSSICGRSSREKSKK